MNKKWLYGLAFLSTISQASEPIKDKNKFEDQYINCIESSFKDNCWIKILSGHALPWAENEEKVLKNSQEAYITWLEGKKIYKVHPAIREIKGEVFDNRSYLLERDDGALVSVWFSFRKVKEQWYVYEVMASSSDEFIRTAIDMKRPHE